MSTALDPNTAVLIVDDYKTMLRVIRALLAQIGLKEVEEARDGGQAAEILRARRFDLVISDWNMEPVSGLDLLKTIRSGQAGWSGIPFIMVTAESKADNIIAAKQAGVSNYIVKPFSAQTLQAKIESVMKARAHG
jgi:two-component system, chemotaxis family, chemotaxis protein CheY